MDREELFAKRNADADRRDMQMKRGIKTLQQISDRGFAWGRLGHQTLGIGKSVFHVFHDDIGFDDDVAVVHQHRYHTSRVELQKLRLVLLASSQIELMTVPCEILLGESCPDFLSASRHVVVIQFQHSLLLHRAC